MSEQKNRVVGGVNLTHLVSCFSPLQTPHSDLRRSPTEPSLSPTDLDFISYILESLKINFTEP